MELMTDIYKINQLRYPQSSIKPADPTKKIDRLSVNTASRQVELWQGNNLIGVRPNHGTGLDVKEWFATDVAGVSDTPEFITKNGTRSLDVIKFGNEASYYGTGSRSFHIAPNPNAEEGGTAGHETLPGRKLSTSIYEGPQGLPMSFGCVNLKNVKTFYPKEALGANEAETPNIPKIKARSPLGVAGTTVNLVYKPETHVLQPIANSKDTNVFAIVEPDLKEKITVIGSDGEAPMVVPAPKASLERSKKVLSKLIADQKLDIKPEDIQTVETMADIPKTVSKPTAYLIKTNVTDLLRASRERNQNVFNGLSGKVRRQIYNDYTAQGRNDVPQSLLDQTKITTIAGKIAVIKYP
jgi:hypothetical protein